MAYTHLDPGQELEISAHIYFSPSQMDISELVKLSPEQLKAQEADSVEQEKAIFEKFDEIEKEWAKQAMLTLSLRKAQQYLKVQPAPHTSNQWTVDQYGRHEMSNMVYCFSWREYERTEWSRAEQKSIPVAWELSWSLHFNTVPNPDYSGSGWQLAGQDRKVFKDRAVMEKYLQGRIAAYSHLFTEISPPIPADARQRFCVNGVLLPGYTVDAPTPPPPDVDELLSLLEDGDMDVLPQPEEPAPPPAPPPRRQAPKKARPQRSGPVR